MLAGEPRELAIDRALDGCHFMCRGDHRDLPGFGETVPLHSVDAIAERDPRSLDVP